jgi:short-subunit dehydrogenase
MLFLVTGTSSGLGLSIANAVLDAGHQCIASSRNPSKTPDLVADFEKRGGKWIKLDVAGPDVEAVIAKAISDYGPIDVLVNNAGYAIAGPVESEALADARALFETNFFGSVRTMQAIIPSMRTRKTGTIVNITSTEAIAPNPLLSQYAATKWAMDGFSESVSIELSALGIRTLIVEPDAIRTEFASSERVDLERFQKRMEPFKGTFMEQVVQMFTHMHGNQAIDPVRAAKAIVQEVVSPSSNPPLLRLPLGKESLKKIRAKADNYKQLAEATQEIAAGVDFDD